MDALSQAAKEARLRLPSAPVSVSAFAYAETWLGSADRFAIESALPLVAGPQFHRKVRDGSVFHEVFADTEPDGWAGWVSAYA